MTLSLTKSQLHSARIKAGRKNLRVTTRLSILHDGLEVLQQPEAWPGQHRWHRAVLGRAATELAALTASPKGGC
jgi:hypothetical protein